DLRSLALRLALAAPAVRVLLLYDVCELVRNESPASIGGRVVGAARERDVPAEGVRLRPEDRGRRVAVAVGVHAHAAEVVPEPRLHGGPERRLEGPPRRAHNLLDRRRYGPRRRPE